jgi:hypothetical protein
MKVFMGIVLAGFVSLVFSGLIILMEYVLISSFRYLV